MNFNLKDGLGVVFMARLGKPIQEGSADIRYTLRPISQLQGSQTVMVVTKLGQP